jgi:tetratricopeptide (TPR) repeat protein
LIRRGPHGDTGRRGRRWYKQLLLAAASVVIVALLSEGLARLLVDVPPGTFFVEIDRDGERWVTDNPDYGQTFQTPQQARMPAQNLFPVEPDPDTVRILVLGESAAMGFPSPEFGLGRTLAAQLKLRHPRQRFEIVDGTMTLINSHLLREIAAEAMDYAPDLVVVYAGNNEYIGPYGPATVFGHALTARWLIKADRWIRTRSVLVRGLTRWLQQRHAAGAVAWQGLDHFQRTPMRADDPRHQQVRRLFASNIEAIARQAAKRDIPVILVTPAVNVRSWPPLYRFAPEALNPARRAQWQMWIDEASRLTERGRWSAALERWRLAEQVYPDDALTAYGIATCAAGLGQHETATAYYERACTLDGYRFRASGELAAAVREVADRLGDVQLIDARGVLSHASDDEDAWFLEHVHFTMRGMHVLAALLTPVVEAKLSLPASGEDSSVPTYEAVQEALLFLPDHEVDAQVALQEFLRMDVFKGQADYTDRVARAVQRQAEWSAEAARWTVADIEERWQQAAVIDSSPAWIRDYVAGRALQQRGDHQQALALFEAALAEKPNHAFHYQWKAIALYGLGQLDEAAVVFEAGLARYPYMHQSLNLLGLIRQRQGDTAAARQAYEFAIAVNPRQSDAMNNLGFLAYEAGNLNEALTLFRRSLAINDASAGTHFHYGLALAAQGLLEEAAAAYQQATTLNPELARVWNAWGMALLQLRRVEEAEAKFTQALALDADRHDARMQRAYIWMQVQGQPGRAVPELQTVLDAQPDLPPARFLYGVALVKSSGGAEAGFEAMRAAVDAAPGESSWALQLAQLLLEYRGHEAAAVAEARQRILTVWEASDYQDPMAARMLDLFQQGE